MADLPLLSILIAFAIDAGWDEWQERDDEAEVLGAVGAGDIGHYFPDTDPQWKGVSSLLLLEKVGNVVREQGYQVSNTDATIVAQQPKLAPHLDRMKQNIAKALAIGPAQVNVKATTTEKLGFPGREEGIAVDAVVLVEKI